MEPPVAASTEPAARFVFDDIVLDISRRYVSRGDEKLVLSRLSFGLLRVLVECAPAVVSHTELTDRVWGSRRVVTPETIAQSVGRLRQALGDSAAVPRYIESVRGHGYRLLPAVRADSDMPAPDPESTTQTLASKPAASGPQAAFRGLGVRHAVLIAALFVPIAGVVWVSSVLESRSAGPAVTGSGPAETPGREYGTGDGIPSLERLPNSIAVLPLKVPSIEYQAYADAIHAALLSRLGGLDPLTVIARASVLHLAESGLPALQVAEELGVEVIMRGEIHEFGGTMHLITEVVDGIDGRQLWSLDLPIDTDDPLHIQNAIATQLGAALTETFELESPLEIDEFPTESAEAWALFARAEQNLGLASIKYLDQAIRLDPGFANAYSDRALIHAYALSLPFDPEVADSMPLAEHMLRVHQDVERALALEPDNETAFWALGTVEWNSWNLRAARAHFERALELNPHHPVFLAQYGSYRVCMFDEPDGLAQIRRGLRLDPHNSYGHQVLGLALQCTGDPEGAYAAMSRAVELDPISLGRRFYRAILAPGIADDETALRLLRDLEAYLSDVRPGTRPGMYVSVGEGYQELGSFDDAQRMYDSFLAVAESPSVGASGRALGYAITGDPERAFAALEEAVENLGPGSNVAALLAIKNNPGANPILDRPEFVTLRERIRSRD